MHKLQAFFLEYCQVALLQFGGADCFIEGKVPVFFLVATGVSAAFSSMKEGSKIKLSILKPRLHDNYIF